jgi:hypothetical protein
VQARLIERTPSMSDLNEVVFGQVLLSFPFGLGFISGLP